ncbi:transcriptional regulator [Putridiphycobacter roseus]|uniref:Transcriptional regulator n=2 Tax=Putridiphycobacter roseus TaxID=2219161 RepID=A0A2W1MYI4_9FLAO|nr:transcriptional regulator [Putridiphycobacter roseus]
MSLDNISRFDRIIAILIQLQSKQIIRAKDLADRFDVSLRTIYRDIRTLEASGVPINSEAGIGYSIVEGYRLPPIMFTKEEAGSFVAAEKLMEKFTDKSLGAHHQSAMFKIKSVLKGKEKAWIDALEKHIHIDPKENVFNENLPDAMSILFESIAKNTQVRIDYQALNSESPTNRSIEPVGLFNENDFWYVYAYCHIRSDYRQFRTDRMLSIIGSNIGFEQLHPPLSELRTAFEPKIESLTEVVILVDKSVTRFIKGARKQYGFISEKDLGDVVEMTFKTRFIENGFSRWYLMFSDYASIVKPAEFKERIKSLLTESLSRL